MLAAFDRGVAEGLKGHQRNRAGPLGGVNGPTVEGAGGPPHAESMAAYDCKRASVR